MKGRIFKPEEYPGKVIMKVGVCRHTAFEIFRNYLRLINEDYKLNLDDDNFNSEYGYICFNFNSIGNFCINGYKKLGFKVIYFDDFDWDLTFLELYNKKLVEVDEHFKKLQDDELRASCAQLDVLMEREKINGQIELLETKIAEDLDIFMNKPPKLEVGQVVELRNGEMTFALSDRLISKSEWYLLNKYDENLKYIHNCETAGATDIVKIYNAPVTRNAAWNFGCDSKALLELVWEREGKNER